MVCTALDEALFELGWTQKELARRSGISEQFMGKIVKGLRKPSQCNAERIQVVLGEAGVYLDVLSLWPGMGRQGRYTSKPILCFSDVWERELTEGVESMSLAGEGRERVLEVARDAVESVGDAGDRVLMEMRYLKGMSGPEVAEALGMKLHEVYRAEAGVLGDMRRSLASGRGE